MSYRAGQDKISAILQAMSNFSPGAVTSAKYAVLNTGKSNCYAIMKPGPFDIDYTIGMGNSIRMARWQTVVELWQRWVDDGTTIDDLCDLIDATIAEIELHPTLDDLPGVTRARVSGGDDIKERWTKEGGPIWASLEVYVDWQEEVTI